MSSPQRLRSREDGNVAGTKLTDLPSNLVDHILLGLPLKDATRTSVLTRKWRHAWRRLPRICFHGYCAGGSTSGKYLARKDKLFNSIYEVLLRHQGPILKFGLSVFGLKTCREIDNVVEFLSRNGIEDLTLEVHLVMKRQGYEGYHMLPSYFYSCLTLKHLTLTGCILQAPASFLGFKKLLSLDLNEPMFSSEAIERFISSCPLLEKLTLKYYGASGIKISAANLQDANLAGAFLSLSLEHVPKLHQVKLAARVLESRFVEIFHGLQAIEVLEVDLFSQSSFEDNVMDMETPLTSLNHLKSLRLLKFNLNVRFDMLRALLLMRNSPNLESVWIEFLYAKSDEAGSAPPDKDAMDQDLSTLFLGSLCNVHLECVTCDELEFVKLFLAKASSVRVLTVCFWKDVSVAARQEMAAYVGELPWAPFMAQVKLSTYGRPA